ncbi:hypothetical protein PVAND_005464 [Polypedilum vanderplanki]|uniref:Shikimate kinase n=1 Tax=Polypedilum vanderplanki TaxID=319348 RepID=A0A9J6C0P2_POLVA|nr:hypothetical protein PVAND_005464 [Polypedilum vanderplanki]
MAHCTLKSHKGVFKTLFYPVEILEYMQKHKIFEIISELMIRIGIERPSNGEIIDFMIMKLIEIAKKFKNRIDEKNVMKIEFYNCCNVRMLRELSMRLHIPLVECCECCPNDNFNKKKQLYKSHLIVCEFNGKSALKTHKCKTFINNFKYLIPNIRLIQNPIRNNIQWNHRVLFVGRLGSGRKTQASMLAHEFGLILIDCDQALMEYERKKCGIGFWGFLQEILLKPHCLCNGYAIVSNVISKEKLEILMEKFIHPPNQIIFIHTNENKCRRRILRRHEGILSSYRGITLPSLTSLSTTQEPIDINVLLNYHMNLYNLHKQEFLTKMKDKIYHVNGNGSVNDIKTSIWAHVARL